MNAWGLKILEARDAEGLTQEVFAKKVGLSTSIISRAERALSPYDIGKGARQKFAKYLHLSYENLVAGYPLPTRKATEYPFAVHDGDASRTDPLSVGHNIPYLTKTAAGPSVDYQRGIYGDRYLPSALVPYPHWRPAAFVVSGDSMAPAYLPGDVLIVATAREGILTDDDVVIGFKTGDHTLKRVRVIDEDTWELVPINSEHPTRIIKVSEDVDWVAPVLGQWKPTYTRRRVTWEETG